VANTPQTTTWAQWYDNVVIENAATKEVYVSTDGATAASVGGLGCVMVLAGTTGVVANRTLKPVASESAAGSTWVSIISAGTGNVSVTPQ
jgi:hypothetical protein